MVEINNDSTYVLGVDFARMGEDVSVFVIIENPHEKQELYTVYLEETRHKRLTDAIGRIKKLHKKFNFRKIYLDETGLGAGPTDVLKEEMGAYLVEGLTFTIKSKEDLYSNLKRLMEQGKLKLPNHRKLLYELADLRYDITGSGNTKIHHPERGHDDYPDALALACWFWKEDTTYVPVVG